MRTGPPRRHGLRSCRLFRRNPARRPAGSPQRGRARRLVPPPALCRYGVGRRQGAGKGDGRAGAGRDDGAPEARGGARAAARGSHCLCFLPDRKQGSRVRPAPRVAFRGCAERRTGYADSRRKVKRRWPQAPSGSDPTALLRPEPCSCGRKVRFFVPQRARFGRLPHLSSEAVAKCLVRFSAESHAASPRRAFAPKRTKKRTFLPFFETKAQRRGAEDGICRLSRPTGRPLELDLADAVDACLLAHPDQAPVSREQRRPMTPRSADVEHVVDRMVAESRL